MQRFTILILFCICCPALGQQILWERSWGHPTKEDQFYQGYRRPNGNYVLWGRSFKDLFQVGNLDFIPPTTYEIDGTTGDTLRKYIPDLFTEGNTSFYGEDALGNFKGRAGKPILANPLTSSNSILIKDPLWVSNLFYVNHPEITSLGLGLDTRDGGRMYAGEHVNWATNQSYTYVYKFDSLGNFEWQQQYGELDSRHFTTSFEYTRDSCFIFSGVRRGQGIVRIFVHKIDVNGNTKWRKEFAPFPAVPQTGVNGTTIRVKEMPDYTYFMYGYIYYSSGGIECVTGKYDSTFTQKIWSIPIDSSIAFAFPLEDGGLLCTGSQAGVGIMVKRTDSLNHNVWKIVLGAPSRSPNITIFNGDSTALLAGYLRSAATAGQPNYWAAKIGGVGLQYNPITSNKKTPKPEELIAPVAYPNPTTGKVWFRGLRQKARLQLTDMQGKKVLDRFLLPGEAVPVNTLTRGLYVWQLVEGAKLWSGKVVIDN